MFWRWFKASIKLIASALLIAMAGVTWLLMIVPDPICFLIGFGGIILFVFAYEDLDKCEKIACKRAEERKRLLLEKQEK